MLKSERAIERKRLPRDSAGETRVASRRASAVCRLTVRRANFAEGRTGELDARRAGLITHVDEKRWPRDVRGGDRLGWPGLEFVRRARLSLSRAAEEPL